MSDTLIGQGVPVSRLIGPCTPSVTAADAVSSALAPRRYGERLLSIRQEMTRANVFVALAKDVAEEKGLFEGVEGGLGGTGEFDKSDYREGLV